MAAAADIDDSIQQNIEIMGLFVGIGGRRPSRMLAIPPTTLRQLVPCYKHPPAAHVKAIASPDLQSTFSRHVHGAVYLLTSRLNDLQNLISVAKLMISLVLLVGFSIGLCRGPGLSMHAFDWISTQLSGGHSFQNDCSKMQPKWVFELAL